MTRRSLAREPIVAKLVAALEPLDHVFAMWEGGAIAFGRLDQWSDIDLYVDVADDRAEETLEVAARALADLAPISRRLDMPPPPGGGYVQSFFLLRGTSPYLLIDLAVVRHGASDKFLEPEIHGEVVFHFNKDGRVTIPHVDPAALALKLAERGRRLRARAEMFWPFFDKYLARGQDLEAIDFYHRAVLGSLVEVLRIRHSPSRHAFGVYYLSHDLPRETLDALHPLFFITDRADLEAKREKAARWFAEEIAALVT